MKFSIKDFLSKCDQIRRKLRIWLYLLKKAFMEDLIFCAVKVTQKNCCKDVSFYLIAKNPNRNDGVKMQQKLLSWILPPLVM